MFELGVECDDLPVDRIVLLGRGGAGKSTLAHRLGRLTAAPVIELDAHFWQPGLQPTPPEMWAIAQAELLAAPRWIMDGDLGPYDIVGPRLAAADTIVILDFGLARCACRALRRSRERLEFWVWVALWRRRSRPALLRAARATAADVVVLRTPRQVEAWLRTMDHPG